MLRFALIGLCCVSLALASCRRPSPSASVLQDTAERITVSTCELLQDRAKYDQKVIEVTTLVSNGFEDFTLNDPACPVEFQNIWFEYGGKRSSSAQFCCDVPPNVERPETLEIGGFRMELLDDESFRTFDKLVRGPESLIEATLIGRFFAGRPNKGGLRERGGFGHRGAYSLLVIQQVKNVAPHDRPFFNYARETTPATLELYRDKTPLEVEESALKTQIMADDREELWRFDDPRRVAESALAQSANIGQRVASKLVETENRPGYRVFLLTIGPNLAFLVEVRRDAWLSHYAKQPERVVWYAGTVYKLGKKNGA